MLAKILNKNGRPVAIRRICWYHNRFTRKWFDGAIIGLTLTKIGHRDFNALRAWSPDISTRVIPKQMTLIDKQDDNRASGNLSGVCHQKFGNLFFFATTSSSSRFGLAR